MFFENFGIVFPTILISKDDLWQMLTNLTNMDQANRTMGSPCPSPQRRRRPRKFNLNIEECKHVHWPEDFPQKNSASAAIVCASFAIFLLTFAVAVIWLVVDFQTSPLEDYKNLSSSSSNSNVLRPESHVKTKMNIKTEILSETIFPVELTHKQIKTLANLPIKSHPNLDIEKPKRSAKILCTELFP